MPWLIKDIDGDLSRSLFFVHVPRCGGTSLLHHFGVFEKSRKHKHLLGKFGLMVFAARYQALEKANFPIWTYGNFFAVLLFVPPGIYLVGFTPHTWAGVFLLSVSVFLIWFFTVIFTAPVICRIPFVHRCFLIFSHYVACRSMESIEWCTGTNKTGYINHLTAHKLLAYNYLSIEEMNNVCSMAIVRNPYSRMVSIYHYNKFGNCESFAHFVEDWYRNVTKHYRETGELEEWFTPCHAIPQFEYTHIEGKQVVRSIVKQEELKYLKTKDDRPKAIQQDSTVVDLPDLVRDALLGMPRTNMRTSDKKWYDYYDQRTLDLVHEMYEKDFYVFKYDPILHQRPDLQAPANHFPDRIEHMLRDCCKSSSYEMLEERRNVVQRSYTTPTSSAVVQPHLLSTMLEDIIDQRRNLFGAPDEEKKEDDLENGCCRGRIHTI
jgi:hypothetical protein